MPDFRPRTDAAPLDTARVLRALDDAGVDYVLIGGVACIAHGAEQLTFDTDILPALNPENLDRLLSALASLGAGVFVDAARLAMEAGELWETVSLRRGAVGLADAEAWHFSTDAGLVDVVMTAAGVGGFDAHVDNARHIEVFGLAVRVAGLDELMRSKETLGRPKDVTVLDQLRRLREAH